MSCSIPIFASPTNGSSARTTVGISYCMDRMSSSNDSTTTGDQQASNTTQSGIETGPESRLQSAAPIIVIGNHDGTDSSQGDDTIASVTFRKRSSSLTAKRRYYDGQSSDEEDVGGPGSKSPVLRPERRSRAGSIKRQAIDSTVATTGSSTGSSTVAEPALAEPTLEEESSTPRFSLDQRFRLSQEEPIVHTVFPDSTAGYSSAKK